MNSPSNDEIDQRADQMMAEMAELRDRLSVQAPNGDVRIEATVVYLVRRVARIELIMESLNQRY